jgi:hypothetical protein
MGKAGALMQSVDETWLTHSPKIQEKKSRRGRQLDDTEYTESFEKKSHFLYLH